MKKLISLAFVFSFFLALAQEETGIKLEKHWLLGGNGKMFVERAGGQTGRLIIEFEPQVGYFFTNWFATGLRFPIDFRSNQYSVGVIPFTRFYLPTKKMIWPFAEFNVGREWRILTDLSSQENDVERSWVYGAQLGAAVFIRDNISIDFYFYYTGKNAQTEFADGGFSKPITIEFIGLGAGFQIYL